MNKGILYESLESLQKMIKLGEVSPVLVANETLSRIKSRKELNAFITLSEEVAIEAAKNSFERVRNGQTRTLEGIPIAIKDIFCTKGIRTTTGSKILENFVPQYESTVTKRILDAGIVNVGKTNMDEFAMGSANKNSFFGPVLNPWNHDCIPGGSSGGSAAAVADYLCYAALGSDTGGSVRQPAALCGIVGLKPSYGRCSRFGMIAYASSLDQAGVFARSVQDACLVMDEMVGYCERDSTTSKIDPFKLSNVKPNVKGKKIGFISSYLDKVSPDIKESWLKTLKILEENGASIVEIKFEEISDGAHDPIQQWTAVYYGFTTVEAFSNLCRYDGIRYGTHVDGSDLDEFYRNTRDQFGDEVKRRMLIGSYILTDQDGTHIYDRAVNYRKFIKSQFMKVFKKVDAIVSPTSPHTAFRLDKKKSPVEMYYEDMFTVVANLTGSPAISIPSELASDGLPIGIQIMTAPFEENGMIEIAKFLESEFKFKKLHEVKNEQI